MLLTPPLPCLPASACALLVPSCTQLRPFPLRASRLCSHGSRFLQILEPHVRQGTTPLPACLLACASDICPRTAACRRSRRATDSDYARPLQSPCDSRPTPCAFV